MTSTSVSIEIFSRQRPTLACFENTPSLNRLRDLIASTHFSCDASIEFDIKLLPSREVVTSEEAFSNWLTSSTKSLKLVVSKKVKPISRDMGRNLLQRLPERIQHQIDTDGLIDILETLQVDETYLRELQLASASSIDNDKKVDDAISSFEEITLIDNAECSARPRRVAIPVLAAILDLMDLRPKAAIRGGLIPREDLDNLRDAMHLQMGDRRRRRGGHGHGHGRHGCDHSASPRRSKSRSGSRRRHDRSRSASHGRCHGHSHSHSHGRRSLSRDGCVVMEHPDHPHHFIPHENVGTHHFVSPHPHDTHDSHSHPRSYHGRRHGHGGKQHFMEHGPMDHMHHDHPKRGGFGPRGPHECMPMSMPPMEGVQHHSGHGHPHHGHGKHFMEHAHMHGCLHGVGPEGPHECVVLTMEGGHPRRHGRGRSHGHGRPHFGEREHEHGHEMHGYRRGRPMF